MASSSASGESWDRPYHETCYNIQIACRLGDVTKLESLLAVPEFSLRNFTVPGASRRDLTVKQNMELHTIQCVVTAAILSNSVEILAAIFPRHLDPSILIPDKLNNHSCSNNGESILIPERWKKRSCVTPMCILMTTMGDQPRTSNYLDMLAYLLKIGASVDCLAIDDTNRPYTALQVALYSLMKTEASCWEEYVLLLLDHGVVPDSSAELLHAACINASPMIVERLLAQGASLDLAYHLHDTLYLYPTHSSYSLWYVRAMKGGMQIIDMAGRMHKPCHVAGTHFWDFYKGFLRDPDLSDRQMSIVKLLLKLGADPNEKGDNGWTAGHFVHRGHKVALYRLLLQHGWDIHATNDYGSSALHYAVLDNEPECVRFLLEAGARLDVRTEKEGYLPIHMIACFARFHLCQFPNIDMIRQLLEAGADLDARTHEGHSAVDLMCLGKHRTHHGAFQWLVKRPVSLPFGGSASRLAQHVQNSIGQIWTDCLLAAGFMDAPFVRFHLNIAVAANNWPRYWLAARANPYAISGLDMDTLTEIMNDREIKITRDNPKEYHFNFRKSTICRALEIQGEVGCDVYEHVKLQHRAVPPLMDIVVYAIRNYLLECNNNTTLYCVIEKLQLPQKLRDTLYLE